MEFPVDIWLRGQNHATTEVIAPVTREPRAWTDDDVTAVHHAWVGTEWSTRPLAPRASFFAVMAIRRPMPSRRSGCAASAGSSTRSKAEAS